MNRHDFILMLVCIVVGTVIALTLIVRAFDAGERDSRREHELQVRVLDECADEESLARCIRDVAEELAEVP